jgi:hypothetical protein
MAQELVQVGFTELEYAKAMKSFRGLAEIAEKDIVKASRILSAAAQCEDPYPGHYATIFILGMLQMAAWRKDLTAFKAVIESHKEFIDERPGDFLGQKRVWARGTWM